MHEHSQKIAVAVMSSNTSANILVSMPFVPLPSDGISHRVQGEYPGWGAQGAAPQHGLQPECSLPPALFRHTEGTGVKG